MMNNIIKVMAVIIVMLLISSCSKAVKISSSKTQQNIDSHDLIAKKTLVDEASLINGSKEKGKEDSSKNSCEDNLNELESMIEEKQFNLAKLDSEIRKNSLALQYLKEAFDKEKEYEDTLKKMTDLSKQRKELSNDLESSTNAMDILKGKCIPKKVNKLLNITK